MLRKLQQNKIEFFLILRKTNFSSRFTNKQIIFWLSGFTLYKENKINEMCIYSYVPDKKALHDLCLFWHSDKKGIVIKKKRRTPKDVAITSCKSDIKISYKRPMYVEMHVN